MNNEIPAPDLAVRHWRVRPTLWIYTAMGIWSLLFCVVMVCPVVWMRWFGSSARGGRFFRKVILAYGKLMIHVAVWPFVRVRAVNPAEWKSLPPGIWVFNHRSASDPFLMAALGRENLVQAVNGWPMRLPFFGYFARLGAYLDITNLNYDTAREKVAELLSEGVSLASFPEGTRSGSRYLNQFKSGAFQLARDVRCPIHAFCIVGNEMLPDRSFRFGYGSIRIQYLRSFPAAEVAAAPNAFVLKKRVRSAIAEGIARLEGSGGAENCGKVEKS